MGEYLREEVNPLLGTQIILGATEEEQQSITKFECLTNWEVLKVLFAGPKKEDTSASLGETLGLLKRIKQINAESDAQLPY